MSQLKLAPSLSENLGRITPGFNGDIDDRASRFENQGEIQYPFEDTTGSGDENKIRGNWASKGDFFALCLGFSVGANNFWRFPYYFYKHGGSAFLLPYLLSLCLIGVPMYLIELSIGQFASVGCITIWKLCPLFKGVGIAMLVTSCFVAIYHSAVIAWSIYYLIHSLRAQVPWRTCENMDWNTINCTIVSRQLHKMCSQTNGTLYSNGTCLTFQLDQAESHTMISGLRPYAPYNVWPSSEFFHKSVLQLSGDINNVGRIHWQLALYSFLVWIFIFFTLFKAFKSAGKVAYIATILPYITLLVFFAKALYYYGSLGGILKFITPDWRSLLDLRAWGDAALQSFFSLCCCWGGLTTMASYNRFHTNCYKQTWLICFADLISSLFFGVVVFATLGALALETNAPSVDVLVQKDYGTAFVMFAESIARSSVAPVWSVLFFLTLIFLNIDTQIVVVETVVTAICDEFPELLRKYHRHVLALLTVVFYAFGIPFCTQAGFYGIILFENYLITWSLLIVAFFECMAIAWVYGVDNLLDNIKWMIGYYPAPYIFWKLLFLFVTPSLILMSLIYSWMFYEPSHYVDYKFPEWADMVGWALSLIAVFVIPLTAFVKFFTVKGSLANRFRTLLSPEDDWGPALAIYRAQQYPLQAPEARDPVKLPWAAAERPLGPMPQDIKPLLSDRKTAAEEEKTQKRTYERETAI